MTQAAGAHRARGKPRPISASRRRRPRCMKPNHLAGRRFGRRKRAGIWRARASRNSARQFTPASRAAAAPAADARRCRRRRSARRSADAAWRQRLRQVARRAFDGARRCAGAGGLHAPAARGRALFRNRVARQRVSRASACLDAWQVLEGPRVPVHADAQRRLAQRWIAVGYERGCRRVAGGRPR